MPVTSAPFECCNKARRVGSARSGRNGTQGAGAVMIRFLKGCERLWYRQPASPEAPPATTRLRPGWATRFLAETAGLPPLLPVPAATAAAAAAAAAPALAAPAAPAAPAVLAAPAELVPAAAVVASLDAPRPQKSAPAVLAAPAPWVPNEVWSAIMVADGLEGGAVGAREVSPTKYRAAQSLE